MEDWQVSEILRESAGGPSTTFRIPTVDPRTGRVIVPGWPKPRPVKRTAAQKRKRKRKRKQAEVDRRRSRGR